MAFVVVAMIVFLGMAAFSIDLGRAWFTQRELQRALDASVLAASQDLPDMNAAMITAHEFGPEATGKNPLKIANVSGLDVEPRCVTSIEGACEPYNALHVSATAEVPTVFAKIFGIDTMTVDAKATACSPCIGKKRLDIMMVLDRTGSMCQFSNGQSDPNCTDLTNAKEGIKTFLGLMDPSVHNVGLVVLPPALTIGQKCSRPQSSWYHDPDARFLLIELRNDYQNSDGTLDTSSNLVSTVNCIRGGGRTAYADAIDTAQRHLTNKGRDDAQHVVIFLSDGAANYGPNYYPNSSPYRATPCHQGITSSGWAQAEGTLVYSIGYDLNGNNNDYEQCHPAWWSGGQGN